MPRIPPSHFPAWEKLGTPPHVLDFVKNGLTLPWGRSGPPAKCEVPNLIAPELEPFVTERISFMERTGRIQAVRRPEDVVVVSRFARTAMRKGRLLLNLEALHECLAVIPKNPGMRPFFAKDGYLRSNLRANDWMAKMDLRDGYSHFDIAKKSRPYLGLQWNGTYYQHVSMPYGLSWSTFMFMEAMQFVAQHIRRSITTDVVTFSDDWMIFGRSYEKAQRHYTEVKDLFADLGLIINLGKSSPAPTQQIQYVGYEINTTGQLRFGPSSSKLLAILTNAQAMKVTEEVVIRELATLRGQLLSAVAFGATRDLLATPHLLQEMSVRKGFWDHSVPVDSGIQEDLDHVEAVLEALLKHAIISE